MSGLKKAVDQFKFLKSNGSRIVELADIRLKLIAYSLSAIQRGFIKALILAGAAIVLFFVALASVLFGLNIVVTNPQDRLWLFFGGAAVFFIFLLIFVKLSIVAVTRPLADLGQNIENLKDDFSLALGHKSASQVSSELKTQLEPTEH